MKNALSLIGIILVLNFHLYSQNKSNYANGFEKGFKEGYCYNRPIGTVCFYPVVLYPPYPRLNENKEDFTQGYNRGFQCGLDLFRAHQACKDIDTDLEKVTIKFNDYVSQLPVEAMVKVGMYKQKMYDTRKDWIQAKINKSIDLINVLFDEQNTPPGIDVSMSKNNCRNKVENYVNTIRGVDFADNYQFSNIQNKFIALENSFYDDYNYLLTQINKHSSKSTNSTAANSINVKIYVYRPSAFTGMLTKVKLYCDGELLCKLPSNSGYCITVKKSGRITLQFRGGGCFESQEVPININSYQNEYFVRYDIGDKDCTYTLVSPPVGKGEYRALKHQNISK